jgi:hypothetical protein
MSKPPQDPLQPVLRDAEAELRRRLHEACEAEAREIRNESAAEIRQLEDALLAAAVAAENTLTLRRHIKRHELTQRPPADAATGSETASSSESRQDAPTTSGPAPPGEPQTGLREFKDGAGHSWRAWTITPGLTRNSRTKHFLGDFQLGWVCFEEPDAGRRRRLPGHPERWGELSEQELERLLDQAIAVPDRAARKDTSLRAPPPDPPAPP